MRGLPGVVQAYWGIACFNYGITVGMLDMYCPQLRDGFDIMNLIAVVVDDDKVLFRQKEHRGHGGTSCKPINMPPEIRFNAS